MNLKGPVRSSIWRKRNNRGYTWILW